MAADATGFVYPTDEAFDDVATAVCSAVEFDGPRGAAFIFPGRSDRLDAQPQQVFVDPIGPISLFAVASPVFSRCFAACDLFTGLPHSKFLEIQQL
jgi:hypothetical protein